MYWIKTQMINEIWGFSNPNLAWGIALQAPVWGLIPAYGKRRGPYNWPAAISLSFHLTEGPHKD